MNNLFLIILLLVASLVLLAFFLIKWILKIARQRDYVSRVMTGRKSRLSREEKRSAIDTIRRWMGFDKSGVELTISKMKSQQRAEISKRLNPNLQDKLQRSGLPFGWVAFYIFSIALSVICAVIGFYYKLSFIWIASISLLTGIIVPRVMLTIMVKRRLKKFTREFPNAVDVLVRGLRSGLPLVDCLRIISQETQDPVRLEFKKVIDDQSLGMPATDAIIKLAERIPTMEVNFLAIVVKIQGRTGGSLTEALQNLSNTLRERRKLEDKIKAVSQEAKSSAAIIGSMPVLVCGALYIFSSEYILLLFSEPEGRIALMGSVAWMGVGVLVMKKMIDFEI